MPKILKTLAQYVVETRKKDTFYMVFNTVYNDIFIFNREPESDEFMSYIDKDKVDNIAREEFIEFMQKNFPNTKLIEVFDIFDSSYLTCPYLGTIAIDCEENDEVYNAICKKYEDSKGMALSNKAVFWAVSYDFALKSYEKSKKAWDNELGE